MLSNEGLLFLGGDVDGLCQEAVDWGGWSEVSRKHQLVIRGFLELTWRR